MSESKVAITKVHYFLLHSRLGSSVSKVVPICVWTALSLYNPVCMLPGWPSGKAWEESGVSYKRSSYAWELDFSSIDYFMV